MIKGVKRERREESDFLKIIINPRTCDVMFIGKLTRSRLFGMCITYKISSSKCRRNNISLSRLIKRL